jgi:MFS family permease
MALLLPEIAGGLGTPESWVGRAVSGYAIAAAVAALVAGPLSDRLGRRGFLAGSAALLGLGSAVSAATTSFTGFALARVATGAGAGVISALSVAAIAMWSCWNGEAGRWLVATAYTAAPVLECRSQPGSPILGWRANYVALPPRGRVSRPGGPGVARESSPSSVGAVGSAVICPSSLPGRPPGVFGGFFVTGGDGSFCSSALLAEGGRPHAGQVGMVFLGSGVASLAGAFERVGCPTASERRRSPCRMPVLAVFVLAVPHVEGPLYDPRARGVSVAARLARCNRS